MDILPKEMKQQTSLNSLKKTVKKEATRLNMQIVQSLY